jgi:tryptophanyl-tRNA synthetase
LPDDHAKAGGVFPVPKAKIGRVARLAGTDGVNKMSKSLNNAIFLYDSEKDVQKKINKITVQPDPATNLVPQSHVLLQYCDAFLPKDRAETIRADYAAGKDIMHGHIKAELGAAINTLLTPIRERRAKIEGTPDGGDAVVQDVIRQGVKKANAVAEETLYLAKKAMKVDFGARTLNV